MKRRYLIGVGNETMTDDGVGPKVADALAPRVRERGFETVVIGHDTLGILSYFDEETERIVFVDCVRMNKRPGDWATFSPEAVESRKETGRMTTHEGDVLRVIELGRRTGLTVPPITIVGIQPESVEQGLELTATLKARFEEYLRAVLAAIEE